MRGRARHTTTVNMSSFYLPGVAPRTFRYGDKVELKVNKLTSVHTQIPYDYYSLKFCRPRGGIKQATENLGECARGVLRWFHFLSTTRGHETMPRVVSFSIASTAQVPERRPHRELALPLVYGAGPVLQVLSSGSHEERRRRPQNNYKEYHHSGSSIVPAASLWTQNNI